MSNELLEQYYFLASCVLACAEIMVWTAGLFTLCGICLRKKRQVWAVSLSYAALMLFLNFGQVYLGVMLSQALGSLTAFCLMAFFREEKGVADTESLPLKAYAAVIFFTFTYLTGSISLRIGTILYGGIAERIAKPVYTAQDAWRSFFPLYCFSYFVENLMEAAILLTAVLLTKKALCGKEGLERTGRMEWKECAILLIPSVAGIAGSLVRKKYDWLFIEKTGASAFGTSNVLEALWALNYLVLIAAAVIELSLFQEVKKKQEEEKFRYVIWSQMCDLREHIAQVERIYAGIRGIRHDFAGHLQILFGLLEQEEYTQARQYLATMQETAQAYDFVCSTGNPVTDVIINEKYREAEQKGICFRSDFHFVREKEIDVFDVSILLSNILNNAFEAAGQTKELFAALHSYRKKNAWFIVCENSFEGQLIYGRDGLPISAKENADMHGLGLKNVKTIVEKHFGTFAIEHKKNKITVTIMLILQ